MAEESGMESGDGDFDAFVREQMLLRGGGGGGGGALPSGRGSRFELCDNRDVIRLYERPALKPFHALAQGARDVHSFRSLRTPSAQVCNYGELAATCHAHSAP